MDALTLEQQLPYAFFTQAGSQQPPPPQPQPPPPPPPASQQQPPPQPPQVPVGLPQGGSLMPSASLTRGPQLPPLAVTVPSSLPQSPPENAGQPPMGIDIASVRREGAWLGAGGLVQEEPGGWGEHQGSWLYLQPPRGSALRPAWPGVGAEANAVCGQGLSEESCLKSSSQVCPPHRDGETDS